MRIQCFFGSVAFVLLCMLVSCGGRTTLADIGCVKINGSGEIASLSLGDGSAIPVMAYTSLSRCEPVSDAKREDLGEKGIRYTRIFQDSVGNRCTVSDLYIPTSDGVLWNVEVKGLGEPWTSPIETIMRYPVTPRSLCWTGWSDCEGDKWIDPLEPRSFQDRVYSYGGDSIWDMNTIALPLFTVIEKETDQGLTLLESPADTILEMKLATKADGRVSFERMNYKISKDHPIRLQMRLVTHNAEWKGGVNVMVNSYPDFFEPKNKDVFNVAGGGAYSSWEGNLDVDKLKKMSFSFNWRAGFDFPFMGMFLPKVSDPGERWERFHQHGVKVGDGYSSVEEMESYMREMKGLGFHVLCYFNLTEVGNHIVFPPPARSARDDEDLWREPNDFVYYTDVKKALVKLDGQKGDGPLYSNWEGCVVVDPAEPFYKGHLLDQARRHIECLPSSSGLCIDRLDWLRSYNVKGDDGVSWKGNRPSRSLLLSWKEVMGELGALMHEHDKVIFANVLYSRIDVMEHLDAVYDEYGQLPYSLNRSALLTFKKPLVAWTVSPDNFTPSPDQYLQRYLYLGAFLTIPYPGNDHTILPDKDIESFYLDYGEMFSMLKGRRWVLSPDAFKIEKGDAKVNLFETESYFVMPVVLGKDEKVEISLDQALSDYADCKLMYPGGEMKRIEPVIHGGRACFSIALERGCAQLVFCKSN